jgi:hypothetical protein
VSIEAWESFFVPVSGSHMNALFVTGLMRVSVPRMQDACRDAIKDGSPTRRLLAGTELPSDRCPQPLLLCSSPKGMVSLFDLREHARKPTLELRCHDQGLTGMAIRSSGILATATITPSASDLHFSEIRMGSDSRDSTCAASSRALQVSTLLTMRYSEAEELRCMTSS